MAGFLKPHVEAPAGLSEKDAWTDESRGNPSYGKQYGATLLLPPHRSYANLEPPPLTTCGLCCLFRSDCVHFGGTSPEAAGCKVALFIEVVYRKDSEVPNVTQVNVCVCGWVCELTHVCSLCHGRQVTLVSESTAFAAASFVVAGLTS